MINDVNGLCTNPERSDKKKNKDTQAIVEKTARRARDNHQSQRILSAAFNCIAIKGYAEASLRDIADEAGVALSQLNYYYKNKEGLFNQVVKTLSSQYISEIETIVKLGESRREKISFLVRYFEHMLSTKPEIFKLLFDLSSMAIWSESLRALLNNLFNDLTKIIEKFIFQQDNPQKPIQHNQSSAALARILLGAIIGTSIQAMLAGGQDNAMDSLTGIEGLF